MAAEAEDSAVSPVVAGAASEASAPSFRPPRSPSSPSFSPRLDADDGLALRDGVERVGVLVALSHDDLARLDRLSVSADATRVRSSS